MSFRQSSLFPPPTCKRCGQEIRFVTMSTGKQMPCDPKEQVLITKDGEVVRGFVPHWATCPYAQEFRKPNPKLADVAQEAIDRIERKGQVDGE